MHKLDELIGPLLPDSHLGNESSDEAEETQSPKVTVAFDIETAELFNGHLRVDNLPAAILGVGAFKTVQAFQLTLSPLRPSGRLGSMPNQRIAAKQPFLNLAGPSTKLPFYWVNVGDETARLYREANVLYWAIPLLTMVYDYVDTHVAQVKGSPPFNIPRLRFVEAGLLLVYADRPNTAKTMDQAKGRTVGMVYLAEEVIDGSFFKYIHNGSAALCQLTTPVANEIAQFLSFTQHVQYTKTGGLVYISDYQGKRTFNVTARVAN